jgi:hypothetical protein
MSDYPLNFQAEIVSRTFGKMAFTVVFVPAELLPKLPLDKHPRLRIDGEVDGIRIDAAFTSTALDRHIGVSDRSTKN